MKYIMSVSIAVYFRWIQRNYRFNLDKIASTRLRDVL